MLKGRSSTKPRWDAWHLRVAVRTIRAHEKSTTERSTGLSVGCGEEAAEKNLWLHSLILSCLSDDTSACHCGCDCSCYSCKCFSCTGMYSTLESLTIPQAQHIKKHGIQCQRALCTPSAPPCVYLPTLGKSWQACGWPIPFSSLLSLTFSFLFTALPTLSHSSSAPPYEPPLSIGCTKYKQHTTTLQYRREKKTPLCIYAVQKLHIQQEDHAISLDIFRHVWVKLCWTTESLLPTP